MTDTREAAATRAAARELSAAVARLRAAHPDSVDLRRLVEDVARVTSDIDLLLGPVARVADPSSLLVIPDHEYDPQLFADADDEGVGPRR